MRLVKRTILLLVVLSVGLCIFIWNFASLGKREFVYYPLGGIPFRIVAYGVSQRHFREGVREVQKRVEELENLFNRYRAYSEVSEVNNHAQDRFVGLSMDFRRLLDISKRWYESSDGAFDITVLPLVKLWNAGHKLPDVAAIKTSLQLVGMDKLILNNKGEIKFAYRGMGIDFGGVAKGYIVDEAKEVLLESGIVSGIIEAGGDLTVWGDKIYTIGIQDPFSKSGVVGILKLRSASVVTSGVYQRYIDVGGKRYPHIIDPRTGYPIDGNILSVTVVGPTTADADALATALCVLGKDEGFMLVDGLDGFGAVILDKDRNVWVTHDLVAKFKLVQKWELHVVGSSHPNMVR